MKNARNLTFYSRKINSFLQVLDFTPTVRDGRGRLRPPSEFKVLAFKDPDMSVFAYALLNSSLFRWFVDVVSDGSHLNMREVNHITFDAKQAVASASKLRPLCKSLTKTLVKTSFERVMVYKHDTLTVQCIVPKHAKSVIDQIDEVLSKQYRFTPEELDFIINYDIKYRMGLGSGATELDDDE